MWKDLLEYAKQVFTLTQEVQKNKSDIVDLREEVKAMREEIADIREQIRDLTRAVERLAYEIHKVSEHEQYERQLLKLQQENEMLRFPQRLLSGRTGEARDDNA